MEKPVPSLLRKSFSNSSCIVRGRHGIGYVQSFMVFLRPFGSSADGTAGIFVPTLFQINRKAAQGRVPDAALKPGRERFSPTPSPFASHPEFEARDFP